jgi:glyoxylase-like metal-dependent hydrolase (beta-lactamase superfamily II)
MRRIAKLILLAISLTLTLAAQQLPSGRAEAKGEPLPPDWCKDLPRAGYKNLERVPVEGGWFEVYRVRPATFAIYEPHQYEEVISYLVVGRKRALLFDTGMGMGDIRRVVKQLTGLPVTVLNSHTHFDHIGDNWQFNDILGVDGDYTRRHEAGATHDELKDAVLPERFCGELPKEFAPAHYQIPPFKISGFVHDGQKIDLGGRTIEVLQTPGHTPDALSLLDAGNKLLFTGDSYYAGPIFLYVPETDLAAYQTSIDRLAGLAPQLEAVLPSHNFPLEKPGELVRAADAFRKVREGKVKPVEDEGTLRYDFGSFSFLLAK